MLSLKIIERNIFEKVCDVKCIRYNFRIERPTNKISSLYSLNTMIALLSNTFYISDINSSSVNEIYKSGRKIDIFILFH